MGVPLSFPTDSHPQSLFDLLQNHMSTTLEFLIILQLFYFFSEKNSHLHRLIRTCTIVWFCQKYLPTQLNSFSTNKIIWSCMLIFSKAFPLPLCAKVTREVRKIRRSKICPFLYSNGHTEAKKIPENFFPWYHLACFFKMKIFKKFFLAKTHQEGLKIGYSKKKFFCKMTRKTLRKISHKKKTVIFF